jgi:hypothetical protein
VIGESDKIKRDLLWWGVALIFYLVGDLVTTYLGLKYGIVDEKNPLMLFVLDEGGWLAVVVFKMLIVVTLQLLWGAGWHVKSWDGWTVYPTVVPRLVALFGLILTVNNIYVLHTTNTNISLMLVSLV